PMLGWAGLAAYASYPAPDGPLPDLHSFPTRRSSDLPSQPSGIAVSAQVVDVVVPENGESALGGGSAATAEVLVAVEAARAGEVADRKSTRLNSSHVSSSYAGVCVKKKKSTRGRAKGT